MTIEAQDTEFEGTARKAQVKLLISIEVSLFIFFLKGKNKIVKKIIEGLFNFQYDGHIHKLNYHHGKG